MPGSGFETKSKRVPFMTRIDAARRWGVPAMWLLCECDAATARQQMAQRTGDVSDADWDVYREAAARWEATSPATARAVRAIDTGRSEQDAAAPALAALADEPLWTR